MSTENCLNRQIYIVIHQVPGVVSRAELHSNTLSQLD